MKYTYIGGGSLRVLPEVREMLRHPILAQDAEIALYDLNAERGEAMATLIRQTPEATAAGAKVALVPDLDRALEGADFVQVTACPWNRELYSRSNAACFRQGWLGSDNLSPNGAFLSLRAVPLALNVARRMERVAPKGMMIVFTNPIAILTAAVNRATSIRAVGICAGQANYIHNISYMMSWDEYDWNIDAEVAGINHFSWIMSLTRNGRDFLPELDRRMRAGLDYEWMRRVPNYNHLAWSFPRELYAWFHFGAMLYSTEPDGLPHLCFYDEEVERSRPKPPPPAPAQPAVGGGIIDEFVRTAQSPLPPSFWGMDLPMSCRPTGKPSFAQRVHPRFVTAVRLMLGLRGGGDEAVAASHLNNGAVADFPDDAIMEYTMTATPAGFGHKRTYRMPPTTIGVTQALVEHQTLVADAIAAEDRHKFLQAIFAYPMSRSRRKVEEFMDEMIRINASEIPAFMK